MHEIFQRHHLPPDEVFAKERRQRAFMYASMELVIEAEEREERKRRMRGRR